MCSASGKKCLVGTEVAAQSSEQSADYQLLRLALHEMRTPLTSVQLNAQLIERSLAKLGLEKEYRLAAMIVSSARKLDDLTRELGDVARLRSGKAALDVRTHDLVRLVTEILSRHAGEGDVGRIRLTVPAGPLPMAVDARRLDRILANLLPIALRQDTARVGIDLRVDASEEKVDFTLTVPWEPLGEVSEVPSDDALGLGLLMARFLVECHGGELEVGQASHGNDGWTKALLLHFWLPKP